MKVSNKSLLRRLTLRKLSSSKLRNMIIIIAIALTSMLFTSFFTMIGNIMATTQEETMRQVGGSSHAGLKYLTQAQYDDFAASKLFKDISYNIFLGFGENEQLRKMQVEVRWAEDKDAKWGFSYPQTGSMPAEGRQVACSTLMLDALGLPHTLGVEVPLDINVFGTSIHDTFTLCGYWEGDSVMSAQQVWLSREYVDQTLASFPEDFVREQQKMGDFTGTISASVWFASSRNIESKIVNLILERGYTPEMDGVEDTEDTIAYGVNWAYLGGGELDITTIMLIILLIGITLLSGYLIIYSIFAISVTNDIHFYGLLKTIGATGRQLRKIVRGQALLLSALGIPVGLLLGWFVGCGLTPFVMNISTFKGDASIQANPWLFLFSALFSLVTVWLSCRKPGKIAAKVSPLEAVGYVDSSGSSKRTNKYTRKVTPASIAWNNVTRNKKKVAVTVLSLSLSLILLNSVYAMVMSFDMEKYLAESTLSDFYVIHYSMANFASNITDYQGITPEFLEELDRQPGVKDAGSIYYRYYFDLNSKPNTIFKVYGVEAAILPLMTEEVVYDTLAEGNYILVTPPYEPEVPGTLDYQVGDKITLVNEAEEEREFEVIGSIAEYPYSLSTKSFTLNSVYMVMADTVFTDFFGEQQPMQTNFNIEPNERPAMESWMADYTENVNPDLAYVSRGSLEREFEKLVSTVTLIGQLISGVLAMIGILNFINAMTTSILARRRELAMLQSIGMSGKQLKSMLYWEGIIYAAFTLGVTFTLGAGVVWVLTKAIAGDMWFFSQRFTLMPSLLCAIPLFLICAAAPLISWHHVEKESLVERLRVE